MIIKFKDGKEIEFRKYGKIWFAGSVIWSVLCGSLDKLRELKAKISEWFEENAPEEIREKYDARLPMRGEISVLPFKYQIVYRKGKTDEKADYILGDEDHPHPIYCAAGVYDGCCNMFVCNDVDDWSDPVAVRLCLEEK